MAKSVTGCLGGAALLASLALNVALITGCILSIDGKSPFIHFASSDASSDHSQCEATLKKERDASYKRLCDIAEAIGLEVRADDDAVALKGKIILFA